MPPSPSTSQPTDRHSTLSGGGYGGVSGCPPLIVPLSPAQSLAKWESENKMVCEQRLLRGEGPRTGWSRELTNDGELILTMTADDVVCTRVYVRE
uniref:Cellular retinoic acid binding protein 2 n=1 Tax=Amazona collaria TaxID=241587 RepID=A0A8B9J139_9PSIT